MDGLCDSNGHLIKDVTSLVPGVGCDVEHFTDLYAGCECVDDCKAETSCSCLLYKEDIYENNELIKGCAKSLPILECGDNCLCSSKAEICSNRCVQIGIRLPLKVFQTTGKGYGLRCSQKINKGQFVAEYAGEVIGAAEVERRIARNNLVGNYIFAVKEVFNSMKQVTYIDARFCGNLARYINHSCNPNLDIVLVRIGSPLVHVGLFANCDISANEELTYDYGIGLSADVGTITDSRNLRRCLCGSFNCKGYLPFSNKILS